MIPSSPTPHITQTWTDNSCLTGERYVQWSDGHVEKTDALSPEHPSQQPVRFTIPKNERTMAQAHANNPSIATTAARSGSCSSTWARRP